MLDVGMLAKEAQEKPQKVTENVSRWTGWLRPNRSNNIIIIYYITQNKKFNLLLIHDFGYIIKKWLDIKKLPILELETA
jgi:hypothetical protein